ncbi:TPA: hypothetical protein ACKAD9_005517 [Pseudomonas aeruginosa]
MLVGLGDGQLGDVQLVGAAFGGEETDRLAIGVFRQPVAAALDQAAMEVHPGDPGVGDPGQLGQQAEAFPG